jgi:hypothetical protein
MQVVSKLGSVASGLAGEMQQAYDPPPGSMTLEKGYPGSLASLWQPGTYNVIRRGAVMASQSEHNMTINGGARHDRVNPNGSHYADPVQHVSYFNGGDAVHYIPRGYGYEQSLGCVELPYDQAKAAYPYLTYGSLMTVSG